MTETGLIDEEALRRFEAAWHTGHPRPLEEFLPPRDQPAYLATLLALICREMHLAWRAWAPQGDGAAKRPSLVRDYLSRFSLLNTPLHVQHLVQNEYRTRLSCGDAPPPAEYLQQYPEHIHSEEQVREGLNTVSNNNTTPQVVLPACVAPATLGHYRVLQKLGEGSFGVVYRGHDDDLDRDVAIKVPHPHLISRPEQLSLYLAEARILASLDHPHIVPVYAFGSEQGLCFVVTKLIDGNDLAKRARQSRLSFVQAAEVAATVAEALHHAHLKGLVHRDVKPANILLDRADQPYLADFGLALREQDFGRGPGLVGTPYYMSPEQARGEGHRVDGRCDVFSLGVVFYELLAGRLPYLAKTTEELLAEVVGLEARPPRQIEDSIPNELERICLKALAKRASERYPTAADMAGDLRAFLSAATAPDQHRAAPAIRPAPAGLTTGGADTVATSGPAKVVPKGLRAFDAHDADFFLELLPGPRDRDALPESLRFWKQRIEETDPNNAFAVGMLYGPSGCGKSSLVRAGLLPRLAQSVLPIYCEADPEQTEARLLQWIRRCCPALPADHGLPEAVAALRRGQAPAGKKVLIVLDQFEQWLHARQEGSTGLVQALRHCDGEHVQCLILVRDDFWMAATRFLEELEVRLSLGQNSAAVDLFDPRHARKVLAEFGRAFAVLPANPAELSRQQEAFLDQAIAGLTRDGRVVCVQLALFAEMVKHRDWTPAALREVGGTSGVGAAYLEEAISSPAACPPIRLHQKAAREVLRALLPEVGSDLKGRNRSREELLAASGYADRPRDFDELLRALDSELRLITPTENVRGQAASNDEPPAPPAAKCYQLTHDYLVPSLRQWLTCKQMETRRGRAELRLSDRAEIWSARPERRHLPAWWEWLSICLLTRKRDWTAAQAAMMRQATRWHVLRGLTLALAVGLLTLGGLAVWGSFRHRERETRIKGLVERLLDAETPQVPEIIDAMRTYRPGMDPLLRTALAEALGFDEFEEIPGVVEVGVVAAAPPEEASDTVAKQAELDKRLRRELHASLALLWLGLDRRQEKHLVFRLLQAAPTELPVIRDALFERNAGVKERLWEVLLKDDRLAAPERFRAACALARDDGPLPKRREQWRSVAVFGVERLLDEIQQHPEHYKRLQIVLLPIRAHLLEQLEKIFADPNRPQTDRTLAANLLAEYARDDPNRLLKLALVADGEQFAILFPTLMLWKQQALGACRERVEVQLESRRTEEEKELLARSQAHAAVILLRLGESAHAWRLLQHHGSDPRVRSYLIHLLAPLGADWEELVKRLHVEEDPSVTRALLLSLGEFREDELSKDERRKLLPTVGKYLEASDSGAHAAAEWLLRKWGQSTTLEEAEKKWKTEQGRTARRGQIREELARGPDKAQPQWYVDCQGHTMVVFPARRRFQIGSPEDEDGHRGNETLQDQEIPRSFAIASKHVTVKQFFSFLKESPSLEEAFRKRGKARTTITKEYCHEDGPMIFVTWFEAAQYCNWLSKVENIDPSEWCYPQDIHEGMKIPPEAKKKKGYRLPTEAEWEYACRAGAKTVRYYGSSAELLGNYAWFGKNTEGRPMPVGQLKPNDFGLFDMHGNVWNWCHNRLSDKPYQRSSTEEEDEDGVDGGDGLEVGPKATWGMRGGAVINYPRQMRSAYRSNGYAPTLRDVDVGFRVARTWTD